jgi:hypothetical protein
MRNGCLKRVLSRRFQAIVLIRDSCWQGWRPDLGRTPVRQKCHVEAIVSQPLGIPALQAFIHPHDSVTWPAMSCVDPYTHTLETLNTIAQAVLNLVFLLGDDRELFHENTLL